MGGGGVSRSRHNEDDSERKVDGGQVVNLAVNSRSGVGEVFLEGRRGKLLYSSLLPFAVVHSCCGVE